MMIMENWPISYFNRTLSCLTDYYKRNINNPMKEHDAEQAKHIHDKLFKYASFRGNYLSEDGKSINGPIQVCIFESDFWLDMWCNGYFDRCENTKDYTQDLIEKRQEYEERTKQLRKEEQEEQRKIELERKWFLAAYMLESKLEKMKQKPKILTEYLEYLKSEDRDQYGRKSKLDFANRYGYKYKTALKKLKGV